MFVINVSFICVYVTNKQTCITNAKLRYIYIFFLHSLLHYDAHDCIQIFCEFIRQYDQETNRSEPTFETATDFGV
jgi:hypothetical protein